MGDPLLELMITESPFDFDITYWSDVKNLADMFRTNDFSLVILSRGIGINYCTYYKMSSFRDVLLFQKSDS